MFDFFVKNNKHKKSKKQSNSWLLTEKFESMCDFLIKAGVTIPMDRYKDRMACLRLGETLSTVLEKSILNGIKTCTAYGIMIDESVDLVLEEHISICCQSTYIKTA